MKLLINLNYRLNTAVSLIIILLITACTPTEARPTSIPTVLPLKTEAAPTAQATAVPTETAQPISPTRTQLPPPTAVPPRYIEPTPTPTPDYPLLPSENSLNFNLQNQLGGIPQAVLVDEAIIYLAVGPRLVAVDVTDPTAPQFMGQSPILGDTLFSIVQQGEQIYGAAGRAGLVTLNVSDPTDIQLINSGPGYSGAAAPNAIQILSSGERIFITNADYTVVAGDLIWFDLAADGQPVFAGTLPLHDANTVVSATNELLFIPSEEGIQVIDPQDPRQELSRIGAPQEIYQVHTAVHNNLLYLLYVGQETRFIIYDITNPTNPQVVPQNRPIDLGFFRELSGNSNILATSYTFGEFGYCGSQITVIDISEPEAPHETGEFDPQNCISDMAGSGEQLYVAGLSGLQIYSTSDPANLQLLSRYTNPLGVQTIDDIQPGQPTSYVLTNEGRGAYIASLNLNQTPPALIGQTKPYSDNSLLQLLAHDQTLVVPVWNSGVLLFDTGNPPDLTQLYAPPEQSEALGNLHGTALVDNVLYMPLQDRSSFTGNLGVFDLQDPTNPQRISFVQTGLSTVEALVADDTHLYLLGGYEQRKLVIINISTPLEPKWISDIVLPADATRLAVVGSTVYAMCDGYSCQSLSAIDVTDAERPFLLNQWQLQFDVVDSVAVGQQLYIISRDNTVRALDVSQPDQPKVIGSIALPGSYGRLTAANDVLYVSSGAAGLFVLTPDP